MMRTFLITAAFLPASLAVATETPSPVKQFEAAYKQAILGDSQAQNQLSDMYQQGYGIPKDLNEACKWAKQAATGDVPAALFNMANCIIGGHLPADSADAPLRALEKAAAAKHAPALRMLGHMYQTGENGAEKDLQKAVHYYQQAADMEDMDAMAELAEIYMQPDSGIQDKDKGLSLMKQAAEKGSLYAAAMLGKIYWLGNGVEKDADLATTWLQSAAEAGHTGAMEDLGIIQLRLSVTDGKMTINKAVSAYEWLLRAKKANHTFTTAGQKSLEILENVLPPELQKQAQAVVASEPVTKRL